MMPPSALSLRLGAEPQCDWVDRKLDGLKQRAQKAQNDLLIAGSRQHLPRSGLMAAQLPRGVQWGMALGRYPTTALRDVLIAIASVVVDDQIVEPMVRMGRRARRARGPVGPDPAQPHARHRRPGRLYEDALVLMWGTGRAVLAAPLNAVVLGATLVGAAGGAAVGAVMAVIVGLCAPRHLLRHLCPSLAILTHLTSNCALTQLAAQARVRQQSPGQDVPAELRKMWARINGQLLAHDAAIGALSGKQDGVQQARELEQALVAVPTLSRFLGLGAYPLGNIDRLLQARATFDADWAALQAPSAASPSAHGADNDADPAFEECGGA